MIEHLNNGISGYSVVRNALSLDYCIELTIKSLLAGCDEVVVGDAASDDGTKEMLHAWAAKEPKLRIIDQQWPDPKGDVRWFTKWINETRENLRFSHQLMLDADEVFDARGYRVLRSANPEACFKMHRLNFWRDGRTLIPHGRCCSHIVARYAPSTLWMTSDEIYGGQDFPEAEPPIRQRAVERANLRIFHYGFLRKREALFAKVEVVLRAFFNGTQDSRLVEAAKQPGKHWTEFCPFDLPTIPYEEGHPSITHPWLQERGAL